MEVAAEGRQETGEPAVLTEEPGNSASTWAGALRDMNCSYKRGPVRRPKHEHGWNKYGTLHKAAKKAPNVSRPSKEEVLKRRQWEEERRVYNEAQKKILAAKKAEAEKRQKEKEQAKLEMRRATILERSKRWQDKHMQLTKERVKGEDEYRRLKESHKKLLHEKLYEEFTKNFQTMEVAKRRVYSERLGRFRTMRPKDIIEDNALGKFRAEVGDVSDSGRRSKSTPCQRRKTAKSSKDTRSRSTLRPTAPPTSAAEKQIKKKISCGESDTQGPPVQNSAPGTVGDQPKEEAGLQKTLEKQKEEEERLEAAPEVVEEDIGSQQQEVPRESHQT